MRNISDVYKKIYTIMERYSLTEIVRKFTPKRFDSSEEMKIKSIFNQNEMFTNISMERNQP